MLISDLITETGFSLAANKLRSFLTILGIVIGIGSVIAMISVGQGATKSISDRIQSLGTNLLVVMPGAQRQAGNIVSGGSGSSQNLTVADADSLKNLTGVAEIAPTVSSRKQVIYKGNNTNTSIYGIDTAYFSVKNITVSQGASLNEVHLKTRARVAILGPETATTLFATASPINQKIKINGQDYTVIGVTTAKGGTGMGSADDLIYIPLSTAQQYLTGNDKLSNINIQVSSEELMTPVQTLVQNKLLARHHITNVAKADFSIMNQADMLTAMSSVSGTLTLLLAAIAGISLVVGGIGIMNMMLTTVTERTREIGLRKSLGAKKRDISFQFLAESVVLTLIGGVIGIIIGVLAAWLITKFSGTVTVISSGSIFLSCGISAAIGILFGYYPAKRAAKLNPIDALRYQ